VDEHVIDLLPAYALDCLDEDEAVQVKEHLAKCTACRAELRAYQAIAGQLPLTAPVVEPPAGVKQALMARIQPPSKARPSSGLQKLLDFSRRISPAWSLASLVLIVVLAASNLVLWQQVNRLNASSSTEMRTIKLSGTVAAPGATGLLVISVDGQHGTLVVDDLPDLDAQHQYQLWLIDAKGERASGGVFSVRDGYGSVWVHSTQPLISYPSFGVTIEPNGGSPAPTGEKVLGGKL
jgi:anti-sigma-K factor RskA